METVLKYQNTTSILLALFPIEVGTIDLFLVSGMSGTYTFVFIYPLMCGVGTIPRGTHVPF